MTAGIPGHHVDVLDGESLGAAGDVVHQHGAFGYEGHAQSGSHDLGRCLAASDTGLNDGIGHQWHAECLGDGCCRYVVVGWPDATGREHVAVFPPHFVHGVDDFHLDVGNHPRFPDLNAPAAERGRHVIQVGVLGAAAQDLVADDQDAGGDRYAACSLLTVSPHVKKGGSSALEAAPC